nr:hypothetical protein [Tanacetum cinerariifolium]GEW15205.1 hypothetical protein [Tanacetum cinerariifolium]
GPHETFQCQPTNEDYCYEQNLCYNSNSFGFDQTQPPQCSVIHQPPQELSIQEMEDLKQQYLDELKRLNKILVPKLPENCARYAKCGLPVNGHYCQGCALLREKLEEDLITYLKYFQDTSESSDDSTNIVNAPREPFVVKKDHGVNPPHIDKCCCECGDALDGIFCQ